MFMFDAWVDILGGETLPGPHHFFARMLWNGRLIAKGLLLRGLLTIDLWDPERLTLIWVLEYYGRGLICDIIECNIFKRFNLSCDYSVLLYLLLNSHILITACDLFIANLPSKKQILLHLWLSDIMMRCKWLHVIFHAEECIIRFMWLLQSLLGRHQWFEGRPTEQAWLPLHILLDVTLEAILQRCELRGVKN